MGESEPPILPSPGESRGTPSNSPKPEEVYRKQDPLGQGVEHKQLHPPLNSLSPDVFDVPTYTLKEVLAKEITLEEWLASLPEPSPDTVQEIVDTILERPSEENPRV